MDTPVCVLKTIVPDGTEHVGCVTLAVVGAAGVPGAGFTVIVAPLVEQVLSDNISYDLAYKFPEQHL